MSIHLLNNNNITIISHLAPHHFDDKLSIFTLFHLLSKQNYNVIVKYYHPQLIDANLINDKNIIKVDIGRIYDPELNAFDHHHDENLECSFVLVLRHFTNFDTNAKFIKAIDYVDRFGFHRAKQLGLIDNMENAQIMREIILNLDVNIDTAEIVYDIIKFGIDKDLMHNQFIKTLFEELYNNAYNYLEIAYNKYLERQKLDEKALEELEIIQIANVTVGISKINIRNKSLLKQLNIDLYIEPGSMQLEGFNQTNLIVMDYVKNKEDAYLLRDYICNFDNINLTFKHNTGFLYVINNGINEVSKIIYEIKDKISKLI